MRKSNQLDAISLEVQWSRLISIMDEVDIALVRTSFSTIVGESRDFAVIMLDRHGRSIAHLNSPRPHSPSRCRRRRSISLPPIRRRP